MKDCINRDKWCILCKFFKKDAHLIKNHMRQGKKKCFRGFKPIVSIQQ